MPNYIVYNPSSSPIAGIVLGYVRSFPEEREAELGANRLKNPDITGITLTAAKVVGSSLVNLSAGELTQISDARTAAFKAEVIAAAKSMFVTPHGANAWALKLMIETIIELTVSEINAVRANFSPAMTARNATTVKNAVKTTYESKVDAITDP